MLQKFQNFILSNSLYNTSQEKILLAASGGMDSMCMLELFRLAEYNFAVAHCNFSLRGEESQQDEVFLKKYCLDHKITFFSKKFDTTAYADENKISIQMAARDLRYEWLEEVRKSENFDYIATAHHKDDEIETFFINISRGTGVAGLAGISLKKDKIIRPLLFASRNDIEKYIKKNQVEYREDSTNSETRYLRNKIRHNILPQFEELNPSFRNEMYDTISGIKGLYEEFSKYILEIKKNLLVENGDEMRIPLKELRAFQHPEIILFELLKEYGFKRDAIKNISRVLHSISGKQFFSNKYKLLKDRQYLLIKKISDPSEVSFEINDGQDTVSNPVTLKLIKVEMDELVLDRSKNIAFLDHSKLKFPLAVRKWKEGDSFHPFGMKGRKLLSDFFIDNKFSVFEKENTWLLCSGDDIVWIIGHRIDDRYKVSNQTKLVLRIEHNS